MPRRIAAERHTDSAPVARPASGPGGSDSWPPAGDDLLSALIALHHPARRQLYELLLLDGPAPVGRLAARTGLAPGSVSHHLKPLHRSGFVEPAPEHARDTRQSWWRAQRRQLSWSTDEHESGTAGRHVTLLAERANLEHLTAAIVRWIRTRSALPEPWRTIGHSNDTVVRATPEQFGALEGRLMRVIADWEESCTADAVAHPGADRRPVRVIARMFPSDPA